MAETICDDMAGWNGAHEAPSRSGITRVVVTIEVEYFYESGDPVFAKRLCDDLERVMMGVVGDGALTASDPDLLVDNYQILVGPVSVDEGQAG